MAMSVSPEIYSFSCGHGGWHLVMFFPLNSVTPDLLDQSTSIKGKFQLCPPFSNYFCSNWMSEKLWLHCCLFPPCICDQAQSVPTCIWCSLAGSDFHQLGLRPTCWPQWRIPETTAYPQQTLHRFLLTQAVADVLHHQGGGGGMRPTSCLALPSLSPLVFWVWGL